MHRIALRRTVLAALAAFTAAGLIGGSTSIAAAGSAPAAVRPAAVNVTNFSFSQIAAVNVAETRFPLLVNWTNGAAYTTQRLYRYDGSTGVENLLATVSGTVGPHHFTDSVPFAGLVRDDEQYVLATAVNGKVLGNIKSETFDVATLDDDNLVTYLTGTWTRKTLAGTTLGHYRVSSTPGASMNLGTGLCLFHFGIVGTTGPGGGTATLTIGGALVATIIFKSATIEKRVLLYTLDSTASSCSRPIVLTRVSGQINIDAVQFIEV